MPSATAAGLTPQDPSQRARRKSDSLVHGAAESQVAGDGAGGSGRAAADGPHLINQLRQVDLFVGCIWVGVLMCCWCRLLQVEGGVVLLLLLLLDSLSLDNPTKNALHNTNTPPQTQRHPPAAQAHRPAWSPRACTGPTPRCARSGRPPWGARLSPPSAGATGAR